MKKHLSFLILPIVMTVIIFMVFVVERRNYMIIFATLYVMTGFLVWIFARPAYHIGVSGVIYALASFLFFGGIMSKRFGAIAISLLVILLYGGMVWGILPSQPHVSWESHALGAVAGFLTALIFVKDHPKREPKDEDYDYKIPGFYDRTSTNDSGI